MKMTRIYDGIKVERANKHDYLGMDISYEMKGEVLISRSSI